MRSVKSLILALVICATGLEIQAQETEKKLLNSERILQKFGSYGVEVIQQAEGIRHANLYSEDTSGRITRTFATVKFVDPMPADFVALHNEILAGASIGSTFQDAGWQVSKASLILEQIDLQTTESDVADKMQLEDPTPLALHIYDFSVSKSDSTPNSSRSYALIAELHHPEYLNMEELKEIYSIDQEQSVELSEIEHFKDIILSMID